MATVQTQKAVVGPKDHGRQMSLEDFLEAEFADETMYELGRGVIQMIDVPNPKHFVQHRALRLQLTRYELDHPEQITALGGGSESRFIIARLESDRHPDLAIYKTPIPSGGREVWASWIPEIVIEIVSTTSAHRDYVEKREDYLAFGVKEYWIVDAYKRQILVLCREGGQWREQILNPTDTYRTPLLPEFELQCEPVFTAADAVAE